MEYYRVRKVNSRTGEEIDYGVNSTEDVKAITKGYQKDELIKNYYSRKGSRFFFIVEKN